MSSTVSIFSGLALFYLIAYGLFIGKELLIPMVIAIAIWYLLITLSALFQKISFFGKRLPYPAALLLALGFIFLVSLFIYELISSNVSKVAQEVPLYQEKLGRSFNNLIDKLPLDISSFKKDFLSRFSLISIAASLAQSVTFLISYLGIIFLYVLFLMLEWRSFDSKLEALFPDEKQLGKAKRIIRIISRDIQSYLILKTVLSLCVALISYLLFIAVGLHFPAFWALVIFLLNYIPTIGAMIGTLLPCALTLIQFDTWMPFIFISTALVALQFIEGNIIEPKLIGKSVNLSPVVILISLAVWGYIWGIVGLFLGIPIMVIVNIILSHFEKTRPIAILLSENGEIHPDTD